MRISITLLKDFFIYLQNNTMCACSNELNKDEEIPTAYCNVTCADESSQKYCGGTESYFVYLSNYWPLFYVHSEIMKKSCNHVIK